MLTKKQQKKIDGLEPTYKELKPYLTLTPEAMVLRLEPTYKELKHSTSPP